uniref:Uncharacterized protein n=1 Tax=viral metagenome TaxID=1070528 RepID=A0A6M3LZY7_9ZZZZ
MPDNITLEEAIERAKKSTGYMITITSRSGDVKEEKLNHSEFTKNFLRDDIYPSLDEHAKNLEPQTKGK